MPLLSSPTLYEYSKSADAPRFDETSCQVVYNPRVSPGRDFLSPCEWRGGGVQAESYKRDVGDALVKEYKKSKYSGELPLLPLLDDKPWAAKVISKRGVKGGNARKRWLSEAVGPSSARRTTLLKEDDASQNDRNLLHINRAVYNLGNLSVANRTSAKPETLGKNLKRGNRRSYRDNQERAQSTRRSW